MLPPSPGGTLALSVAALGEAVGLFVAQGGGEELYVARAEGALEVAPWESSSPRYMRLHHGRSPLVGIVLRQIGPRVNVGRRLLANKVAVTEEAC